MLGVLDWLALFLVVMLWFDAMVWVGVLDAALVRRWGR
jgi:hypothetical protein